VTHSVNHYFRV